MSLAIRASVDNETVKPALSQAVGYVVVVVIGLVIASGAFTRFIPICGKIDTLYSDDVCDSFPEKDRRRGQYQD